MSALQRAVPLVLTVFCGVIGGYYTFQPVFAPDAMKGQKLPQGEPSPIDPAKNPAPVTK